MWFRNSGGVVPAETLQMDSHQATQETRSSDSDSIVPSDIQDRSLTPNSYGNNSDGADDSTVPSSAPPPEQSQSAGLLNHMVDTSNEGNVTSLFWDPSFSAPDPLLDFDWLFDDMSANFNGDAGLSSDVISPARTGISDISPPSFPMGSQGIRFSVPPDTPSLAPWMIVQSRLFEALNTLPRALLASPFFLPSSLSHFFDLYFENYHPHFPILHQPTLDPTQAPPLLIAAIVTLGSTLSCEEGHFQTSVQIHDTLRYIIFNVSAMVPVKDLQFLFFFNSSDSRVRISSHRPHYGVFKRFFSFKLMRKCSPQESTINWHTYSTVPL